MNKTMTGKNSQSDENEDLLEELRDRSLLSPDFVKRHILSDPEDNRAFMFRVKLFLLKFGISDKGIPNK